MELMECTSRRYAPLDMKVLVVRAWTSQLLIASPGRPFSGREHSTVPETSVVSVSFVSTPCSL